MLLATWNVNSLRARMPRLEELLERHRPDVVCLQETKAAPEAFPHLELQALGYVAADDSGGRWNGVAVLVREDHELGEVVGGLPGSPVPDEARWLEAVVHLAPTPAGTPDRVHDSVRVATTYVVNGRGLDDPQYGVKLDFLARVAERVDAVHDDDHALVAAGDWNVAPRDEDVWDPTAVHGGTHVSRPERDALAAVGLTDAWDVAVERSPHRFTWWDYRAGAFPKDRGMRIDLVMVDADLATRVDHVGIDRELRKGTKPSDHAPLLARLRGCLRGCVLT